MFSIDSRFFVARISLIANCHSLSFLNRLLNEMFDDENAIAFDVDDVCLKLIVNKLNDDFVCLFTKMKSNVNKD